MKTTFLYKFATLLPIIAVSTLMACSSGSAMASGVVHVDARKIEQFASPPRATNLAASSCLSAQMGTVNNGAWWVSGSFNIVNSCSTAQALSGTQIQISSAGNTLNPSAFQINTTTPWLSPNFATITGLGSAILLTVNSVTSNNAPYMLAANGGTINVNFGYNPNGKQLGSISATINGATPVVPATLSVAVNSTGLANYCTTAAPCNIPVILSGQSGQYSATLTTITNSTGNTTYKLTGLMPGSYTLSTGTLPSKIKATYSASTVTLGSGESGPTLTLTFAQVPNTTGVLNFTLTNPAAALFETTSIPVSIQGSGGSPANIQAVFDRPVNWTLTAGSYILSTQLGLASASDGAYYQLQPTPANVTVDNTTVISPVWNNRSGLVSQPISITGLNNGDSATLTFTDNNYTFNQETVTATASGQTINTTYKFPAGDTVTVNVTTNANYVPVAASTITIPSGGTSSPLAITLSTPVQPAHQIVGYYETWFGLATWTADTYSLAKIPSYVGIIPLAFARPDSTYVAGSYSFYSAGLGISALPSVAKGAIQLAQAKGQKLLLSVGGATYPNFAAFNLKATLALVQDLGLDGVDLDYESDTNGCSNLNTTKLSCPTDAQMINIITQLRNGLNQLSTTMNKRMYLTAAVWSIGAYGSPAFPTTSYGPVGSKSGLWVNPLLQVGNSFDALFLMSYDAGNVATTGYNPISAFQAYKALYNGPIYLGVEVPPEAWGGNVSTPAQSLALATAAAKLGSAGTMIWALQVQGFDPSAVNSMSYLTPICNYYGLGNCSQPIPLN